MKHTIQRMAFITFMALAMLQLSACDDVKRIIDTCTTDSVDGSTNVECKP